MTKVGVKVSGQGPLIVFLHSSLSSSKQWHTLVKSLSGQFTCINIDLLGYGEAEQVIDKESYSFDVEVKRILAIINTVKPNSTFHLIGHSCGAAIALKIAVEYPTNVLSLIIYEPVAFHLFQDSSQRQPVYDFSSKLCSLEKPEACKVFVDYWNGDGFFDRLPEAVQLAMVAEIDKVNLDFIGIFSEQYQLSDLSNFTNPCLLFVGNTTQEVSKELSFLIAKSLNNSTILTVEAGHMGPVSHPQLVEPIIQEFLNRGENSA